jgi:hypothetical protein
MQQAGGKASVKQVKIKSSSSADWINMENKWGGAFEYSHAPSFPLDVMIYGDDGPVRAHTPTTSVPISCGRGQRERERGEFGKSGKLHFHVPCGRRDGMSMVGLSRDLSLFCGLHFLHGICAWWLQHVVSRCLSTCTETLNVVMQLVCTMSITCCLPFDPASIVHPSFPRNLRWVLHCVGVDDCPTQQSVVC